MSTKHEICIACPVKGCWRTRISTITDPIREEAVKLAIKDLRDFCSKDKECQQTRKLPADEVSFSEKLRM